MRQVLVMASHSAKNQSARKLDGMDCEDFIKKFYKGSGSGQEDYDVETKTMLIEVKSCKAVAVIKRKGTKTLNHQFGRFCIDTDNHIGLKLRAEGANKRAMYAFVLRIENRKIHKLVKWEDLPIDNSKKFHYIGWIKIFGGVK